MDLEFRSELLKKVAKHGEMKDLILISSIPIVLVLVFLMPSSVQEILTVNYENPFLLNFLTSAFVHSGVNHLAGNVVSYMVVITVLYLMCSLSGLKRNFRYFFLIFVFIFPFVLSGINFQLLEVETSMGFSGVDSAFLGFLPVVVFHYMDRKLDLDLGGSNSILLFLLGTEILVLIYAGLSTVFLVVLALIGFYSWRISQRADLNSLKESINRRGHFELSLVGILLFLGMTFSLFPKNIVVGGKAVNILSHYSGYFLGFFVPYFWFQIEKQI